MKKADKVRRNQLIVGVILIIFMVSSMGTVLLYNSGDDGITRTSVKGKEYEFLPRQDSSGNYYYEVKSSDNTFKAYMAPEQARITGYEDAAAFFDRYPAFSLSFDPTHASTAYSELIRFDLRQNTNAYFSDATTVADERYSLPVLTCADAGPQNPVIVISPSNVTKAELVGDCLKIDYQEFNVLQVRDMLIYLSRGFR